MRGLANLNGANPGEHFVYRFFDGAGGLLYVGMTRNLPARLAQHRRKSWFAGVRKTAVESHPDWRAARVAERLAIRDESPLYNVAERSAS